MNIRVEAPFILILVSSLSLHAGFSPGPVSEIHGEFRDSVYNQSLDSVKVSQLYSAAFEEAAGQPTEFERLYWSARIHFLKGWHSHRTLLDKKRARQEWQTMLRYSDSALKIKESSDLYRLKAEATSHLCMVTSVAWVLINGMRISGYCERALDLNPENGKAMFILGASKTYPPFWFGGNTRVAIRLLNRALRMEYIEVNDRYNIYTALGVAHLKDKNFKKAIRYLEKSLEIYPNNNFSRSMLQNATKKSGADLQKYYPPEKEE